MVRYLMGRQLLRDADTAMTSVLAIEKIGNVVVSLKGTFEAEKTAFSSLESHIDTLGGINFRTEAPHALEDELDRSRGDKGIKAGTQ